ncbi:MAG: Dyp-type peroxidase, partial [Terrabacter sp.]|nr:Dyp-type peroxidase [Terrabacter sp.]
MTDEGLSRRRLLGASGTAAVAGVVAGAGTGYAVSRGDDASAAGAPTSTAAPALALDAAIPFRGEHQAGIVTPAQDRLHFVALDVVTKDRAQLRQLLVDWTRAAERMTAGAEAAPGGLVGGGPNRAPEDTGEAYGLPASGLTITIGYGPSLFDDRFGLAPKRPAALRDLPAFTGDQLDPRRTGGDLCIQACANDPQVAVHAVRNLVRIGFGVVAVRWSQLGFGRTSSTSTTQDTPRNLMGFKDGTNNIKLEDTRDLDEQVWVGAETDQPWMRGGTYLVARRIRMLIESWDTDFLADQEAVFGRFKNTGAPLTGTHEFDAVDLNALKGNKPVIPVDAHIRLAAPATNAGHKLLRRGYSYTDGIDPDTGLLDAGLFFIA